MHSIIRFLDENNKLIDFYRLKQKQPKTVLQKVIEGFKNFPSTYLTEGLKKNCAKIRIHYTDYSVTEENKTFECSFNEFLEMLKA